MLSHVPNARLLVVAPDADLRQSLAFLFEVNEFAVRISTHWPPDVQVEAFDAIILDEVAVARGAYADSLLVAQRNKIILLAGRVGPVPAIPHAYLVHKPLLDNVLLDDVQAVIAAAAPSSK